MIAIVIACAATPSAFVLALLWLHAEKMSERHFQMWRKASIETDAAELEALRLAVAVVNAFPFAREHADAILARAERRISGSTRSRPRPDASPESPT